MNQLDNDELRQRVELMLKVEKQRSRVGLLVGNFLMYLFFMGMIWIMTLSDPQTRALIWAENSALMPALLLPTIGWGIGVFFHLLTVLMEMGIYQRQIRERAVMRVLSDTLGKELLSQSKEKVKNRLTDDDAPMQISEEGELVPTKKSTTQATGSE